MSDGEGGPAAGGPRGARGGAGGARRGARAPRPSPSAPAIGLRGARRGSQPLCGGGASSRALWDSSPWLFRVSLARHSSTKAGSCMYALFTFSLSCCALQTSGPQRRNLRCLSLVMVLPPQRCLPRSIWAGQHFSLQQGSHVQAKCPAGAHLEQLRHHEDHPFSRAGAMHDSSP